MRGENWYIGGGDHFCGFFQEFIIVPDKYQVRTGTKKFRMKKEFNSSLCDDKIRLSSNLAVVLIMRQNEMLCHRECKTKNAYGSSHFR